VNGESVGVRIESQSAWIARSLGRGELSPLPPEEVAALAAELGEVHYAGGSLVFREGEAPAMVHIVREGLVELGRVRDGRRVAVQVLHPGDVFGDVPLLLRHLEPFDARALVDSSVLSIDSVTLFGLLRSRPALAQRWLVSLAERMAGIQQRLLDLLAGSVDAQIASTLLREGGTGCVELTQALLADLLGVQRSTVNRSLQALAADGLIELGYREVGIRDPDGLAHLAATGERVGR